MCHVVAIYRSKVARTTIILISYPTKIVPKTFLETTTYYIVSDPLGVQVVEARVEIVAKATFLPLVYIILGLSSCLTNGFYTSQEAILLSYRVSGPLTVELKS